MHYVAVFHDVFLTFGGELSGSSYRALASQGHEVVIFDDLRPDEPPLEIGMDHSGSLRGLVSLVDRPRAALIGSCGKECLETQEVIGALDLRSSSNRFMGDVMCE